MEVVVVENGGETLDFEVLCRAFALTPAVRLVKLQRNRYFGEGNNIGVDISRGHYVMFLNNDCFLREDFGAALFEHLAERPLDCVGACLLFPDGTIQEFGGIVSDGGEAMQRLKGLGADFLDSLNAVEEVDYVSAACVVLPRSILQSIGGFDPAFEPFFYEDTDLFRRIRAIGGKVLVNLQLRAVHIENASTAEFLGEGFHEVVRAHRALFARRWLKYKGSSVLGLDASETVGAVRGPLPSGRERSRPVAILYTPFDISPGGGERYLLAAGSALSNDFDVVICSEVEISTARVRFALNALGIAAFPFRVSTWDEIISTDKPDLLLAMGNEVVPPVPAIATRNWFHLQFPFPWRNVASRAFTRIKGFECIIVNSDFTADWSIRRFKEFGIPDHPPIKVIHPPVRTWGGVSRTATPRDGTREFLSVVNVGRFFVGGHSKRQDIFLDIVEEANRRADRRILGTLIGSAFDDADSAAFLRSVEARARVSGLVRVILDAGPQELMDELFSADVYLHCGGFDVPEGVFPERLEHFGITIAESVFAGCYPVVYDAGGPREILSKGGIGEGFRSIREAAEILVRISHTPDRYAGDVDIRGSNWFTQLTDQEFARKIRFLAKGVPHDVRT